MAVAPASAVVSAGSVPVVCLVRALGVQRPERNVLVVSIDRLIPSLRGAAAHDRPVDELGICAHTRR